MRADRRASGLHKLYFVAHENLRCRKNPCKPWGRGNVRVATLPPPSPHGACTMTTTARATAAGTILAIDLGKYKSVAWTLSSSVSVERVPANSPERVEQFCVEGFVTSKLETGSPLVHELGPRRIVKRATLPDTARVPRSAALLRSAGQWKELLAWVTLPPPPSPGALLQFNELLLARHVDVVDALASHSHDTSARGPNPDDFALRRVHVRSSQGPIRRASA